MLNFRYSPLSAAVLVLLFTLGAAGQVTIQGLTVLPAALTGGQTATGTVTLAAPAPAGGVLVTLSSNNPAALVPASITILATQTSGTFNVTTTSVATIQNVTITATSANSQTAPLTVNPPPTITGPPSLPSPWTQGAAYLATTVTAAGGTGAYTWAATGLPPGLTIGAATGVISGTPTTTTGSPFSVTVTVTDSTSATGNRAYSVAVNPPTTITAPVSLPSPWTQGIVYPTTTLTATGGTGTFTWSLAPGSGPTPTGLSLSSGGVISGIPSAPGPYLFTVRATDAVGGTADKAFSITVNPPPSITTASPLPPSTQSVAYSQTLLVSGGTAPFAWSATGLPAWLTLNPSTGALTGTSTTASTFGFTVRATDATTAFAERIFSLTINPPPAITGPASLPSPWTQGAAYPGTAVTGSGGTGGYTWSATGLPPGLAIAPTTGIISGIPTSSVGSPFTVTVSLADSVGSTANRGYSIAVNAPPSITAPAALPAGTVGAAYPATPITATGGTGSYTWSATGLPPALSIEPATGVISGTPTTVVGSPFSVTVTVTDSVAASASQAYSLTITSPTPTITTIAPSSAIAGGGGFTLTVNGTNFITGAIVNWNASPLATTFVSATQLTAAVPAANIAAAGSAAITVSNPGPVTSAPAAFTIIAALAITTTALPSGTTGVAYAATLQASGGTAPHTWSVPSGLPGWLTLNASTGALSGTPTAAGTYFFTVRVTDGGTPTPQTADKPLSITVASGLTVVTSSLAAATVSAPYSQTLTAAGGLAPYSWALTGGSLPPGLSLATSGLISGTPTAVGSYSFTVQVSDSAAATATKNLSITVSSQLTIITTSPLPDGAVGRSYSTILTASGGTPPYVNWQVVNGALPSGLSLSSQAGFLSGIPVVPGSYTFAVQVSDSASVTATKFFTLTVSSSLSIVTATLPGGATGTAYSQTLAASGGTSPYSWTVASGSLPPGITLTASTGTLSGAPTSAGSYSFSIRVSDSASVPATAVRDFVVVISEGLTITSPAQLPSGSVGVAYSATLTAAGGRTPYTWSVASGNLPPGLALNSSTGVLSGSPTTVGAYTFVFQVTDSTPTSATKAVSLTIAAGLTITSPAQLPAGATGTAYSYTLTATGGSAPYTWAVTQGRLPAGLSLSSTGGMSGTPTAAGSFGFLVQVTDNTGRTATQELSLTIASGLTITNEATLPSGTVGVSYSQTLAATGGAAPYSDWRVISGILPAGLSLEAASGRISGTPTAAGTLKFTVQVKDSTGKTGSKEFTLAIQIAALTIATSSPLPAGVVGRSYSLTLQASGGASPYSWRVTEGSLPAGLSLEASTGQISGTPTAAGAASFTLEVSDSTRRTASKAFALTIDPPPLPAVQIIGPPDTAEPAQQPAVQVTLASGYPLAITGQLTLAFEPDAVNPSDDPAVQFSTGGRTVNFSIAANATQATFPAASPAIQTGTVAGAITLRATLQAGGRNITPTPAPVKVSRLLRSAPVIRSVQVERTSSGFDVVIKGFSTPRQVTQATFRFTPAAGANLQTTELTVPLTALADPWFRGQESAQYGSQFTLRQPFTVQGDSRAVSAVSVTLTNSVGSSLAASAGL